MDDRERLPYLNRLARPHQHLHTNGMIEHLVGIQPAAPQPADSRPDARCVHVIHRSRVRRH